MRLASFQLNANDHVASENSFQQALRITPLDGKCWQGLGESYRRGGKYLGLYAREKVVSKICRRYMMLQAFFFIFCGGKLTENQLT